MLFQNAVFERDGKDSFAEVFRRSPISTAQILHPQLYFDGLKPGDPDLPDHLPRGYKPLVGGSLGELDTRSCWSSTWAKNAPPRSPPIGGARPLSRGRTGRPGGWCCFMPPQWDSEDSARRYFMAYRECWPRNGST